MAFDTYMQFQDASGNWLKGESQAKISNDSPLGTDIQAGNIFEIDDFSFDIEQVLNIGSQSSGAGAGKVTFNPFSITRKTDRASPTLFTMCCAGQHFKQVSLYLRRAGGGGPNLKASQGSVTSGTTFLVKDFQTALDILPGTGPNTIEAEGFTFTDQQRNQLFDQGGAHTIIDTSGTYTAPYMYFLTAGADSLTGVPDGSTVVGTSSTLNSNDQLVGGGHVQQGHAQAAGGDAGRRREDRLRRPQWLGQEHAAPHPAGRGAARQRRNLPPLEASPRLSPPARSVSARRNDARVPDPR